MYIQFILTSKSLILVILLNHIVIHIHSFHMVQGQRDPQGQKDIGKTAGGKEY